MATKCASRSAARNSWALTPFRRDVPHALVLLVDAATVSPWDPELLALVGGLEELLDGSQVTLAAAGSGGPSLADALAAVRFGGATSAVVAVPPDLPGWDLDTQLAASGAVGRDMRVVSIRVEMDVHAVAERYRAATVREWTRVA